MDVRQTEREKNGGIYIRIYPRNCRFQNFHANFIKDA
jgi:hypothetical protein